MSVKRGPKPDREKDEYILALRNDKTLDKSQRTFRAIGKRVGENVKNVYERYKRAGGQQLGRIK